MLKNNDFFVCGFSTNEPERSKISQWTHRSTNPKYANKTLTTKYYLCTRNTMMNSFMGTVLTERDYVTDNMHKAL